MFSGLDESELNIVIDAMDIKEAKNSEVVITQGDDGDVLYLLGNGLLDCH
jgi:CRP-like cAMP-binding protein